MKKPEEPDHPRFLMKQRLALHLPARLIALTFGGIFIWRAWFAGVERGEYEPFYVTGLTLGAIFMFLVYLFFPVGLAYVRDDRIRITTLRLFGLIRREAGEVQFDDIRRLETHRIPLRYFRKQVIVLIHLSRGRVMFDAGYLMEDRKRLTRLLHEKSGLLGFEVIDNVGLLSD